MTNKELAIKACKTFVCPNLGLIDLKCRDLHLKNATIKVAKDIAIQYFKKTYDLQHYLTPKFLFPSFVFIACMIEKDNINKKDLVNIFGVTDCTIRKWTKDIINILDLKLSFHKINKVKSMELNGAPDLTVIEEIGKSLSLQNKTLKMAKDLAIIYFDARAKNPLYKSVDKVYPSIIYCASIIENDKRNLLDISLVTGRSESYINRYYKEMIKLLGLKIVFGFDWKVLSISGLEKF